MAQEKPQKPFMPTNKKIWEFPKELPPHELKAKKEKLRMVLKQSEEPNLTSYFNEMK